MNLFCNQSAFRVLFNKCCPVSRSWMCFPVLSCKNFLVFLCILRSIPLGIDYFVWAEIWVQFQLFFSLHRYSILLASFINKYVISSLLCRPPLSCSKYPYVQVCRGALYSVPVTASPLTLFWFSSVLQLGPLPWECAYQVTHTHKLKTKENKKQFS